MIRIAGRLAPAVLIMLSLLLPVIQSTAHPLSVSYSSFTLGQQQLTAVYRLPIDDMDLLLRLDRDINNRVSLEELHAASADISDYLHQWTRIVFDGVPATGELRQLDLWEDSSGFSYVRATVLYPSASMIRVLDISVNVLTHLYQDHRNLAEFILGNQREEHVFYRGNSWSGTRELDRSWQTVLQFVQLGMQHIFTGYDHILFLLGLLLVAGGIRRLVLIITSFTVAHSITLALSTLEVIRPSSQLIEIIIALSIAYVGLENLLASEFRYRWVLTFLFGLAHGFGFATVLQNMNPGSEGLLPGLLAFNVGVEIGQLVIVAIFLPLLRQLANTRYRAVIVRTGSVVILVFGSLWLAERILLL